MIDVVVVHVGTAVVEEGMVVVGVVCGSCSFVVVVLIFLFVITIDVSEGYVCLVVAVRF